MADTPYKISLGVDVDVSDIQSQISTKTDKTPIPIKVKIDNLDEVKRQIQDLGDTKGNKNLLSFDTTKIENSLREVKDVIKEIGVSLSTLDGKSGMKSLITSVNQIATALGKVEDESDSLLKSLSALSKKDFSVNFDFKMGKSASQISSEQGDIKRNAIGQLKQQAKALQDYLDQYYKVSQKREGVVKLLQGTSLFSDFWGMSRNIDDPNASLKQQVSTYKQYIDLMQEAAKIKGVDLSSITSGFSKTTNDIVEETKKVSDGAEEVKQALKGIFGGSLDVEGLSGQLQPIITDLGEIKTVLQSISSNNSIDGLTQSFDRLSETLEKLTANLTLAKNTLDTGFSNTAPANNAVKVAQQTGQNIGETISKSAKQSINIDDVIDEQVLKLMNEYAIAGNKSSKAFDEIKQSLNDFRSGSGDISKVTSAISNNMKVVNEAKNDYKDLAEYIRMFNASGAKVHIPDSIRQEYGDDYKSMRSQLGKGFTSGQGMDFETFVVELNSILGDTIDLSHGAEAAFGDLVNKVNSTKGSKFLTGDDLFRSGILNMGDVVANVSTSLEQIDNAEEQIAQTSTTTANTLKNDLQQIIVTAGSTSDAIKQMQDTMSSMKFDRSSIDAVAKDLEGLGIEISKISVKDNGANLDVTVKGVDDVGRAVTEIRRLDKATDEISPISKSFTQSFETSADAAKRLEKETTASFKKLKSLAQDMGEVDIRIAGLDADKDTDEIRGLQRYLDGLKSEYEELYAVTKQNLSSDQFKELEQIFADTSGEVREFKKELTKSAEAKELVSSLERLKSLAKEISGLRVDIFNSDDADEISKISAKLEELSNEYSELFAKTKGNLDDKQLSQLSNIVDQGDKKALKEFNNELSEFVKLQNQIENTRFEIGKLEVLGGKENEIAKLKGQLEELEDTYYRLIDIFGRKVFANGDIITLGDYSDIQAFENGIANATKNAEDRLERFKAKYADTRAELAKGIKVDIEAGNFDNQIDEMYAKFDKLSGANVDLRNSIQTVESAYREMLVAANTNTGDEVADTERLIQAQEKYAAALKKTNNLIKIQAREDSINEANKRLADSHKSLELDMVNWLKKNTKAAKEYGNQIDELIISLNNLEQAGNLKQVDINSARRKFGNITKTAESRGLTGLTLFDQIKEKSKEYMAYFSVAEVFMEVTQALKAMFDTVVEIDTAMTGLYRVTDLTAAQYDTLFDNMIGSAKEYGATLNDIINATTDWVRAGFEADTALGLAEVTTMYQHISDLDYDTAAENLITAYNGFKDELNGAFSGDQVAAVNYIADIFNELDNNFAVTSAGLGEALTRSASALDLAGNSIQETAGMVTGIVEVTQDPEKAGSALKVLSLRLRGMKGQLEELGEETDENVENISKMQGQILNMTKGKVNIFDGAGNFKSTYEIMKGIAEVWDELSSIDQANLLETIAGKNRANDVAALLSNWKNVEAAVKSASEAEGSAAKENAKYVDSLQGRLDKLTTVWQSFANAFMNSDFLKGGISALTTFVEILEGLIDKLGSFGTIGLGAGIFSLFRDRKVWSSVISDFSVFGSLISDAWKSSGKLTGRFKEMGKAAGLVGGSVGKSLVGSLSATVGAIGLVVAAVGLVVNAYKNYKEEQSRQRQEIIETSNAYLDASSTFEQAYIKYSDRTDLTQQEEAELETAIKGTVDALGDKSSALQSAVNSSNDYLASLEAIKNAELEAAKAAAEDKRDNAAEELREAAIGWEGWDGSEVDISLGGREAVKIAKEVGGDFYKVQKSQMPFLAAGEAGMQEYESFKLELSGDADISDIVEYYNVLLNYKDALSEAGLEESAEFEKVGTAIEKISESISVYTDGVYEAVKANYQLSEGIPKTAEEYIAMREAILTDGQLSGFSLDKKMSILNSLDSEYGQLFDLSSAEAQARKFVGIIEGYGDGTKDGTNEIGTVETFLNMRTAVNNNECTVGEYLSELDNVTSMSEKFSDGEKEQFNLAFGIDTDSIKKQYENVYNYISRNYLDKLNTAGMTSFDASEYKSHEEEKIKDILDGLSATELQAVANIKGEINWETTNTDKILAQIKEEARFIEAMNYTIAIDVETESLDALNSALSESVSGAGLSSESIAALKGRYAELASQGYDLSTMFEETSNGIHLNKNAVSEFEQALASQKLSETDGKLDVLKKRYDELTKEIDNCTDAGERASLYSEQQEVAQKINDLATLASQYKGLTSAYNAWQNAESAGNERDMYESIIEGFENVGDEISRGWYDDGTIKFLELMTGQTDLAGKSASELKEIWNSLDDTIKGTSYSVKDFFTTDEDGNSTSTGAYNFLKAVEELGKNGTLKALKGKNIEDLIVRNDKNKIVGFDFDVVGGDKAIADALGVSEEMVQIIQRTLDDAGFVVTLDGKYTLLADLKTSAEEANNTLKRLKTEGLESLKDTDLNFDFDVNTVEGYQEQLEKATAVLDKFRDKNGKLKTDANGKLVKGAQEALDIAEYYTAAMDKLTEPKFMQIDTSVVDEELQDPIEKMQTIGDLCKEKHLVTLTGDTEEIDKVQGEIDKVAKEIEKLDPEIKAQIGIDEDWDAKTIADKIEKGEIEVPAELKLDVQMSEDLKDMRLLMMRQLGLVSEEEVKLKVGYEIDESAVDDLTPDEQKVVVEFIAENEDWFDKLTDDEKKVAIELVASGVDLDSLTDDEKKEVVIEFITKNEDEFDKLSDEEKQVVVDIVADDKALKALEEHGVEIEAFCRIFGVEKVDDLKKKLEQLDDEQILVLAEVLGRVDVEKLKTTVAGLDDKTVQAIAKALGEGDVNGLKTTINGLDDKTVQAIAEAFGYSGVDELNKAIENLDPKTVQAIAQALGITDVDSLRNAINRLTDKDVKAAATVDGKDDVNSLKSAIDNLKGKTITVWASIKKKASSLWDKLTGGGGVDGTAHVNGTAYSNGTVVRSGRAFKQGDWGTKDSGVALGGEEAPELLVRNGRWHLIGEKGAEFFGYKKGDIIFNASQTKEIFEKGKITHGNGRGKALVSGTAFSGGTGGGEEPEVKSIVVGTNKNTGKSYTKSTDNDDFEETFDLIEVAIDRVERAIDQLDKKANNIYKSWSERNSALTSEISKVRSEINLQQKAYNEYMVAANSVGLSSSWVNKIKNGNIDITTVKDEALAEKISDYQKYYEAALDCKDAIEELKETEAKLYAQRVENAAAQYDGVLGVIEHEKNMLEEYISQSEAQGWLVSEEYYKELANNEKENIAKLKEQKNAMLSELQKAMESGTIEKESEAWYDMVSSIDEVTLAITQSETALLEYQQTLQQLDWEVFDIIQEKISGVTEEADFLIELLSSDKLFDDNGQLTGSGMATVGLHGQNYNAHMYQADMYAEQIYGNKEKGIIGLNEQIEKDPYDMDLINRRDELLELQREAILAANDEKEAIRDMVSEGIELELDALQELIDKKNEELESERDLYEYQKKVLEQTREISSLEKQIASYSGDSSEEAKAKVQELKVSLEEAKSNLEETERDKILSDTQQMLDNLYLDYETALNTRLDNLDALVADVIMQINADAVSISGTISEKADSVGYTLSNSMSTIWDANSTKINTVITTYGEKFTTLQTTTNNALGTINSNLQKMITQLNSIAKTNTKSASTSSASNSKQANTTKKTTTTEKKPTTNPAPKTIKVGGKINAGSAPIYDYAGAPAERQLYRNDPIYTVLDERGGYLLTRWHKLSSGYTGWFKKSDVSAYATGKKDFLNDEIAWTQEKGREYIVRPSDGAILTPIAKGDSVLNATASSNIWDMANSPTEFIRDNLNLGTANVPNVSSVNNSITQHFENITFSMPNVHGYNELLTEMQRDPKFEKLVLSMTIDQIAGKSKLAKGKSIR